MRRVVVIPVAVSVAACEPERCLVEGGVAELGTGEASFEPLADGDTLGWVAGPQGGFHVYGSVRTQGLSLATAFTDPEESWAELRVELFEPSGAAVAGFPFAPRVFRPAFGWDGELFGQIVQFFRSPPPTGSGYRLEVEVVDAEGVCASDARTVSLAPAGSSVP